MALDPPFDHGRVQTANVAVSASTVSANIILRFNIHVQGKTTFIFPTIQTEIRQQRRVFLTREEDSRASFTQAAPNELKLGEGG